MIFLDVAYFIPIKKTRPKLRNDFYIFSAEQKLLVILFAEAPDCSGTVRFLIKKGAKFSPPC